MTGPSPSDAELVDRARAGDVRSFEELVRGHQERVFNTVYRMVGDYEEACDLTQEAFLNAYRGLARFRSKAQFSTWIYRIAMNAAYSHLRRRASRLATVPLAPGGDPPNGSGRLAADGNDPAEAMEKKERVRLVERGLAQLRPEDREIVVLRDIEGRDYGEIAQIMDCPRGTVKSRLFRARDALRRIVLPRVGPGAGVE